MLQIIHANMYNVRDIQQIPHNLCTIYRISIKFIHNQLKSTLKWCSFNPSKTEHHALLSICSGDLRAWRGSPKWRKIAINASSEGRKREKLYVDSKQTFICHIVIIWSSLNHNGQPHAYFARVMKPCDSFAIWHISSSEYKGWPPS